MPLAWLLRARLASWLIVAIGLLGARPVLGAQQSIVFDLDVEPSHQPTHICVISTAGSRTGTFVYSLPLEEFKRAYDAVQRSAGYEPPPLDASLPGTHEDMRDAIASLGPISEHSACEAPGPDCNPTIDGIEEHRTFFSGVRNDTSTKPLHVVCGHNSAHPDRLGKVLLLSLNFMEEDDVPVTEVRLDGGIAAITLTRRSPPNVVARVAGGHYMTGHTHAAIGGRFQIPLEPRCVTRTVALPRVNLAGAPLGSVGLQRGYEPNDRNDFVVGRFCEPRSEVGRFDMVLSSHEGKYLMEVGVGTDGSLGSLATRWTGGLPQEIPPLSFTRVTFAWVPDCTYELYSAGAEPKCPEAKLGGTTCKEGFDASRGLCLYTCDTSATFELPATVELSSKIDGRWDGRVDFPGQILDDYVPVAQRRARLDFSAWEGMPLRERARIRGLTVRVGGQTTFFDLRDELFSWDQTPREIVSIKDRYLTIPRSGCQSAQYEVVGERRSEVRTTNVEHGVVIIDSPRRMTASSVKGPDGWFDGSKIFLGLSVGHMARLGRDAFPVTRFGDGLDLRLELTGYVRPWARRSFIDFGYLTSVGTREYVRVDGDVRELRAGSYARVGGGFTGGLAFPPLRPLIPRVDLGLGGSGGFGFVFLPGEAAGMRGGGFLGPHARVQIGPVALYLRFQFFERLHELRAVTGERLDKHRAVYSKLELQYRFDPMLLETRRKARKAQRQR